MKKLHIRQYEWSAVTIGKISENSFTEKDSDEFYNNILTDDETCYRIGIIDFRSLCEADAHEERRQLYTWNILGN
tara:strand:- start:1509 stop:1733 length:225 start_codon:yes stop_codon:yes gene_type:complete